MPPDMSLAEHYQQGYAAGEVWAENDAQNHPEIIWHMREVVRSEATLALAVRKFSSTHENHAAYLLGRARGYRVNSKK